MFSKLHTLRDDRGQVIILLLQTLQEVVVIDNGQEALPQSAALATSCASYPLVTALSASKLTKVEEIRLHLRRTLVEQKKSRGKMISGLSSCSHWL